MVGTATALPAHRFRQDELAALAVDILAEADVEPRVIERFFSRTGVKERYLALPPDGYRALRGFEDRSRAWLEVALELGERTLRSLFEETGIDAAEIGQLVTTTVTGVAVPSLDARLMNRLPFARDLRRVPLFGLGCVAGAAGVARVADYLRAYPDRAAVLLSVELCSLTMQPEDVSVANIISTGLFGDGAAAVLMVGAEHPRAREARPNVLDSRSVFFPNTERVMGWDMVDTGFKIVLSADVPRLARQELPPAMDAFLADHGLQRADILAWVTHPGGPKVIDAVQEGLQLDDDALAPARAGLAEVGNLSSASVLFLLNDYLRRIRPKPGSHGILLAMGPAFCAELVLLRW